MIKKDFTIVVDSQTINREINMLFAFDDPSSKDRGIQTVAWQVDHVKRVAGVYQHVSIQWQSSFGFALASKDGGQVVRPKIPILVTHQTGAEIISNEEGVFNFQAGIKPPNDLASDQISATNSLGQPASLAVGFVKNSKLVPIGYVAQLPHMSSVVARYTTRLKLWVASTSGGATWQPFDGNIQTGQTIDTIQSEAKAVHVWNLADPMDTPDNSQWVLSADDCGNYHIKLKPS